MSRGQTQHPLAHLSYSLAMAFSSDHPVVLSSWSARNSCSMAGPITQWQLLFVWGGSVEAINFGHSVGWNRLILHYHLDEQHWYLQLCFAFAHKYTLKCTCAKAELNSTYKYIHLCNICMNTSSTYFLHIHMYFVFLYICTQGYTQIHIVYAKRYLSCTHIVYIWNTNNLYKIICTLTHTYIWTQNTYNYTYEIHTNTESKIKYARAYMYMQNHWWIWF